MNHEFLDSSKEEPGKGQGRESWLHWALFRHPVGAQSAWECTPQPSSPSTAHTPTKSHSWTQDWVQRSHQVLEEGLVLFGQRIPEFWLPAASSRRGFGFLDPMGGGHYKRRTTGERSLLLGFKRQSDHTTWRLNLRKSKIRELSCEKVVWLSSYKPGSAAKHLGWDPTLATHWLWNHKQVTQYLLGTQFLHL